MKMTFMDASAEIIQGLRQRLLAWGAVQNKEYPWRYQSNPYRVLVSEFMLHRTQTRQVLPVYKLFIQRWPSLANYAQANGAEVNFILSPLGLKWRVQGMQQALTTLWKNYGTVPTDYDKLICVRGIGPYIAGATVCFTQNQPIKLADSNIVRVIGRVLGLDLSGEARRRRSVIDAIAAACDPLQPRDFYYAVIDLAHEICHPRRPACGCCPLRDLPCVNQVHNNGEVKSD